MLSLKTAVVVKEPLFSPDLLEIRHVRLDSLQRFSEQLHNCRLIVRLEDQPLVSKPLYVLHQARH